MENEFQEKSKTQVKKEATALQKLGEELIKLPVPKLERLPLPDALRRAVMDAKSITSNVAGKRQRQYIGALMRKVDPAPIRNALLALDEACRAEPETGQKTREWMDRLLTGDPGALEEFLAACPGLERQRLRQLIRNIGKEKGKKSRSFNTLEQLINDHTGDGD